MKKKVLFLKDNKGASLSDLAELANLYQQKMNKENEDEYIILPLINSLEIKCLNEDLDGYLYIKDLESIKEEIKKL